MAKRFDYSFLWNGGIPARIVQLAQAVQALRGMSTARAGEYGQLYGELEKIACVQSVKSSNAIEGIVTTDARIRAIVAQGCAPLNHAEAEIAGYRDALAAIHQGHATMQVDERSILQLHAVMQTPAGIPWAGRYKQENNLIMEMDSAGQRRIRFTPCSAAETPQAMGQMLLAYREAAAMAGENNLLLIPCVVLDFLCIHPFADGNGRISRLLTLLMLYRTGHEVGRYISLEQQINNRKAAYYRALEESSRGWQQDAHDYFPFMEEFLSTLFLCYKELDNRFALTRSGKVSKTARVEATVLDSLIPVSKAEICALLPDVSPSTVEAVLGKMVRQGQILRIGSARAARYVRA